MKTTLSLNGRWQVRKDDQRKCIPARVPGDVHADLLRAKQIPDPFYRDNEDRLQWIGESDWIYSRSFRILKSLLKRDKVILRCLGLDTFATVRINGKTIAKTDNMFREWEWDVKSVLKPGANTVEIRFDSVLPYTRKRQKQRPLPNWCGGITAGTFAWVRKEACNFGWDWGPKLVTCGIWRSIEIVAYDTARLTDIHIRQNHTKRDLVRLTVAVSAKSVRRAPLAARVTLVYGREIVADVLAPIRAGKATAQFDVLNPRLWWPNNMGKQPLYDVTVALLDSLGHPLDVDTRRIGLRELLLDRHPDKYGESFQFVVNGVPFFSKGANWIPADAVLGRMTPARYRRLVADAADANMNMLRVWGGGIYEDDIFYDICDELGICIWQDFMFSCSTYPTFDRDYMRNADAEARDNIRRLRHHPCIAIWCGNNEIEGGLVDDKWTDKRMAWKDYVKLFDGVVARAAEDLDPQRYYCPSSPHSPVGDRNDFNNPDCGDAHLWGVWHGREPFEWYRTCDHRFNSEFGFQSFPEPRTVRGYTDRPDRNITSRIMEHHQRSSIGNTTIMQYMLEWFRVPEGFEMTLWTSQILQGMAIKYAVEHWRRSMPRGMGTLYWQHNDCWPVASWSSIDFHGRWKALHYMAGQFFAPLMVSGVESPGDGKVDIHVTNDHVDTVKAKLKWHVTDVSGRTLLRGAANVVAKPCANSKVRTLRLAKLLSEVGNRDLLVWLELSAPGHETSRNLALFCRPKHMDLASNPGITMQVKQSGKDAFAVTLRARRPALWVWLELPGVDIRCSDNFFHLRPGASRTVRVTPSRSVTAGEFRKRLVARSLANTYQ